MKSITEKIKKYITLKKNNTAYFYQAITPKLLAYLSTNVNIMYNGLISAFSVYNWISAYPKKFIYKNYFKIKCFI